MRVPAGALVVRPDGTQVAEGARRILNPSDDVVEGRTVHVIGSVDSEDE